MDTKKGTRKIGGRKKKSTDPFARSDDESGKSEDETLFKSESESESEEKVVIKKKTKKKIIKKTKQNTYCKDNMGIDFNFDKVEAEVI